MFKIKITKYHFFISTPVPICYWAWNGSWQLRTFVLYQFDIKEHLRSCD